MKLSENLKTNLFAFLGAFVCVAIFISFDKCSQEDSSNDTNSYYENNAGSDNESNSESNTVSLLKTWALQSEYLDYDDVSIREVKKLPEDSDFDYKIFADIEQGSIKCTIYLFVSKHSVNHVFLSPTSIINFTSKKQSYDDTRRSSRDNELLQRAQSDL